MSIEIKKGDAVRFGRVSPLSGHSSYFRATVVSIDGDFIVMLPDRGQADAGGPVGQSLVRHHRSIVRLASSELEKERLAVIKSTI